MRGWVAGLALAALLLANAAVAEDLRPFCADRPGKETPPCVVDVGHAMVEFGVVDFSTSRDGGIRTTNTDIGNLVLRFGVTSTLEASVGWTPLSIAHSHGAGISATSHSTGDVMLAVMQSLKNPSGEGVSIALRPALDIPTQAGRMSMGVSLPVALPLPAGLSIGLTPEIDRVPDAAGPGNHAAASAVVALGIPAGPIALGTELWFATDYDPAGHVHQASFDVTAAWVPESRPNLQFDAGVNFGLNHATDDIELYVGVSRRF